MAVNHASRRVMEKAGLEYVRTFHLEWEDPLPGTEYGEVEYALTRDDWRRDAGDSFSPRSRQGPHFVSRSRVSGLAPNSE
jgi:hypothetical protein